MTELRQDYLTGEWVAISTIRAERPFDTGPCPFCPQNTHMTPQETYSSGRVRAFLNKYPALDASSAEGYGIHEVLVDTDVHDEMLHEFTPEQITAAFMGLRERMLALTADAAVRHVQIFKNQGRAAGASQKHSHWQILAMPMLPDRQLRMRDSFDAYYARHGRCYLCDQLSGALTVLADELVVAYVPRASAYADGVNVTVRRHVRDFSELSADEYAALALALKRLLTALLGLHPGIGYNICVQNGASDASHVFLQLIPRLGSLAGFELATGCFINSVDPAETVRRFRERLAGDAGYR